MTITRKHPFTGQTYSKDLTITEEELDRWNKGELIQNVWPHLSSDDREYILTGICDWDSYIPEELPQEPRGKTEFVGILDDFGTLKIEEDLGLLASPSIKGAPVETEKVWTPPSRKIYCAAIKNYKLHKLRPILKYLSENVYLAGGSLRTVLKCSAEDVSDFDLFFKSFEAVQPLRTKLEEDGYEKVFECPKGFLYTYKKNKHKVQLICETEYASVEELLGSFDVSACVSGYYGGLVYYSREFVRSVRTKKLRTCNVTFPVATLKRLIKYSAKGYFCGDAAEDFCREINGKVFDSLMMRHYID